MRKQYMPRFAKMNDMNGIKIFRNKRAEAIAEYFEKKQWKKPADVPPHGGGKVITEILGMPTDTWTLEQVQAVIKRLKKHKAPGPDGTTTEMYKMLDEDNVKYLLELSNEFWQQRKLPTELGKAIVASI